MMSDLEEAVIVAYSSGATRAQILASFNVSAGQMYRWLERNGVPKHSNTICSVDGCDRRGFAKRLCTLHYQRRRKTGSTGSVKSLLERTAIERFMAKVEEREDGCWQWTGGRSIAGYGRFGLTHDHSVAAHRFAYEHFVGPIPEGLTIDHLCHGTGCPRGPRCIHRACVNPSHLEAVTVQENLRRRDRIH